MTTEFEWVDEIPKRTGGGAKVGGGKYAELVKVLEGSPGKIAKLGPFSTGAASGAVARLKELGADATSRAVDKDGVAGPWVFVSAGSSDDGSESIFDTEGD